METAIKVNFKKDGKATSTTLNYNICKVYCFMLNESKEYEKYDTYRDFVKKKIQEFVNEFSKYCENNNFTNLLNRDYIEFELLSCIKANNPKLF